MIIDPSLVLIFGGCCSNVFALEAIVKHEPGSGILITVTQLLFTALVALPSQLEYGPSPAPPSGERGSGGDASLVRRLRSLRVRAPKIPLRRLALLALIFCSVNVLNNWAFAFQISVPMHIILRSFGSVTTMAVGWLVGKTYSRLQVLSVLGLTVGVVVSAWADASAKGAKMDLTGGSEGESVTSSYVSGLAVLFIAQLLGAAQGIYTERTYATYGRHWTESLFYSHFLGTLFSLAFLPSLHLQLSRLLNGPRFSVPTTFLSMMTGALPNLPSPMLTTLQYFHLPKFPVFALLQRLAPWSGQPPSQSFVLLLLNAATQVVCISGVNRLAARVSAVTVTVVLNVRKLASFLLSCLVFGNKMSPMMMVGAAVVFGSGAVYGWDSSQGKAESGEKKQKKEEYVDRTGHGEKENGIATHSMDQNKVHSSADTIATRSQTRRRRAN